MGFVSFIQKILDMTTVNGISSFWSKRTTGRFRPNVGSSSALACLLKSVVETNRGNWALEYEGVKNLQWTHANSLFHCIIETEQKKKYEPHSLRASTLNL